MKDRISRGCYDTRGIGAGGRDLFPLAEGFECVWKVLAGVFLMKITPFVFLADCLMNCEPLERLISSGSHYIIYV